MASRIEQIAALAMKLGQQHLEPYGAVTSRHDFTQRQLMSCLVLKTYLKTTYRGVVDFLEGHAGLRRVLGMEGKLPHYTSLQKFSARDEVLPIVELLITRIGQASLRQQGPKAAVVLDSTGVEISSASAHYQSRTGRRRRKFMKISLSVICTSLLPLALELDWGPSNDKRQAFELLDKTLSAAEEAGALPAKLYADAGYDADWIHGVCREIWGVQSWIKPACCRADGTMGGVHRGAMTPQRLKKQGYGQRWHVESFISGLKRVCGSTLGARRERTQHHEAAFKVLAYALHR
jgi:Transposase DDE domain